MDQVQTYHFPKSQLTMTAKKRLVKESIASVTGEALSDSTEVVKQWHRFEIRYLLSEGAKATGEVITITSVLVLGLGAMLRSPLVLSMGAVGFMLGTAVMLWSGGGYPQQIQIAQQYAEDVGFRLVKKMAKRELPSFRATFTIGKTFSLDPFTIEDGRTQRQHALGMILYALLGAVAHNEKQRSYWKHREGKLFEAAESRIERERDAYLERAKKECPQEAEYLTGLRFPFTQERRSNLHNVKEYVEFETIEKQGDHFVPSRRRLPLKWYKTNPPSLSEAP